MRRRGLCKCAAPSRRLSSQAIAAPLARLALCGALPQVVRVIANTVGHQDCLIEAANLSLLKMLTTCQQDCREHDATKRPSVYIRLHIATTAEVTGSMSACCAGPCMS